MEVVLILALVLPWLLIGTLAWLLYVMVRQHGRILLKQDEIRDLITGAQQAVQTAQQRPPGLTPGTAAPEFQLSDLAGRERALSDFRGEERLLVFFDTQCGFCQQLAPELGKLPEQAPRLLLVGRGEVDALRHLAAEYGWDCDIVFQEQWELGSAYQASGTPAGYLIDAEGRIASEQAVGADALLALAGARNSPSGDGENGGMPTERARAAGLRVRDLTESRLKRDGLKSGTAAPVFSLPDLWGKTHSLADHRGKRVLLVFSDVTCGPCDELAPKLAKLHLRHTGDGLEIVMISRGGVESNRAKAEQHGIEFPVLLQRSWEVSKDYAMFATPIAYLIDEQGTIAEDVAVGSDAILALV